jgi:hypothetical protein
MPKVAKKSASGKSAPAPVPLEPLVEHIAAPPPLVDGHVDAVANGEPRTPAHSPTRPHIGYFGRSSCPCWRCVRNMGPLQRRKECAPRFGLPNCALVRLLPSVRHKGAISRNPFAIVQEKPLSTCSSGMESLSAGAWRHTAYTS